MITVLADIEVQPGSRQEFIGIFQTILDDVRAEEGCIMYEPAIDVQTSIGAQAELRENILTVVEKWRDEAALTAHLKAPHMDAYRQKVDHLVVGLHLRVLESAES